MIRNVEPSDVTYQNTYAQASKFASENTTGEQFDIACTEQGLSKKSASVRENDRTITGLENPRSCKSWTMST